MFTKRGKAVRQLITHIKPKSQIAEQYRNIRTNIHFSTVGSDIRSILVTSPSAGEGKTTTIANLAVVFGQQGKKVLVIDADMRKPTLHELFQVDTYYGLTSVLSGQASLEKCLQETDMENVSFLSSGPLPPNPAELLGFRMIEDVLQKAYQQFDLILVDTPPVLAVTDAHILANQCDGIILVVRSESTEKEKAVKAKQVLEHASGKVLGVILNAKEESKSKYGYY
ncbi:CpsD/CapB family tyrosine-protein kinase [Bacillus sp. S13(2024)]|uniref:CpsD/CapB family tyrosine-protein kinase n=1 Tax=unclassified Bacillus (in: firmicutes) TaxID=185979 RepID=UPI003D1F3B71